MVITVLIGNGFDIGLGMKTRYTDFLDLCYLREESPGNSPVQRLKQHILKEKVAKGGDSSNVNWADAEWAFGQLDEDVLGNDEPFESFRICLADFKNKFEDFLRRQNDAVSISEEKRRAVGQAFCECVVRIGEKLATKYRRRFYQPFRAGKEYVEINVITYNYTDVLDRMLSDLMKFQSGDGLSYKIQDGKEAICRVKEILHVHGDLKSDIIFGVDDESQIKNEKVREGCRLSNYLVKKDIDFVQGDEYEKRAVDLINKSNCIITLGLSFGETDKTWWGILLEKARAKHFLLVPCVYRATRKAEVLPEATQRHKDEFVKMFKSVNGANIDPIQPKEIVEFINFVMPSDSTDPDGNTVWCDPFNLQWIGKEIGVADAMKRLNLVGNDGSNMKGDRL